MENEGLVLFGGQIWTSRLTLVNAAVGPVERPVPGHRRPRVCEIPCTSRRWTAHGPYRENKRQLPAEAIAALIAPGGHAYQRYRDQDDCRQLEQVGPRRRVFKRMRRVDTEAFDPLPPSDRWTD